MAATLPTEPKGTDLANKLANGGTCEQSVSSSQRTTPPGLHVPDLELTFTVLAMSTNLAPPVTELAGPS